MTIRELPLGDQGFAEIIDQNLLYADKTRYIHELYRSTEKHYFLSRPRRFGKTLLLNTINELFSGDSSRFRGLWIGGPESGFDFPRHPVLSLSLSMRAPSPEALETRLLGDLKDIAAGAGLDLRGASPDACFGNLIKDLGEKSDSKVVVLIDEYDAPVTRNMHNPKVAKANASVLHDFFATLKIRPVSDRVRLTVVTGITRYALTSMDSGPNHLNDISLDPRFAGVCGFTLDEFGPLFEDRLPATLASLKETGKIGKSANLGDLSEKIFHWYDGYNWGGATRILNPLSILRFFQDNSFSDYWIQKGRPAHLTALIRARPFDFLQPKLKSYLSSREVRKTELTRLKAVPCLFHSGYLTLDKIKGVLKMNPITGTKELVDAYSFRLPNFEVADSYRQDCFDAIFDSEDDGDSEDDVRPILKREALHQAFLNRDAQTVADVIKLFLARITYHQRSAQEKTFHSSVHLILMAMDFTVQSELPGAVGRLDLRVELPDRVHLIIEVRHCPKKGRLTPGKRNLALAAAVMSTIDSDVVYERMAPFAANSIGRKMVDAIMYDPSAPGKSKVEKNRLLWRAVLAKLSKAKIDAALAEAAEGLLSPERIKAALLAVGATESDLQYDKAMGCEATGDEPIDDQSIIDHALSKAADQALRDITARDYHGIIGDDAVEIIDLGLAVYDQGQRVKAVFGPARASDPPPPGA